MRHLAIVLALAVPLIALGGSVMMIQGATRAEITDCPSNGGDGGAAFQQVLPGGDYLARVTDENVWLCFGAYDAGPTSCIADAGEKFPPGSFWNAHVPTGGVSLTCRSTGGTGDVIFTPSASY